jgi:putative transposase
VKFALARKLSARRACELSGVSRRRLGYASGRRDDAIVGRLKELAAQRPRFGYRRLHQMLKREGHAVNVKRVRRLCAVHGLKLSRKIRRKRRGQGVGVPCRAQYANHVWAYDFVHDVCENGRKLKVLTVEDEFTRRCLAIEVEHRMCARFVARTLLGLFAGHGAPTFVRSDNGPEFIAKHLMRMLKIQGVECRHIEPGSPWQNGINERFNGSYRDECANLETFHNRDHARALSRLYVRDYNEGRPHSSLGYLTPREFAGKYERTAAPTATK